VNQQIVIESIHSAFDRNRCPGDAYLQRSFEGCEPYEEIEPFKGKNDLKFLDSKLLDAHYNALSFFSEAGFRFFLPAYLIADVRGELQTADPLFHLTGGFFVSSAEVPAQDRVFVRRSGGSTLLNPKRYGAMTFFDYACFRLSIFAREEAQAIVAYLKYRRDADSDGIDSQRIDAALKFFWLDRAEHAPSQQSLESHLQEDDQFFSAMSNNSDQTEDTPPSRS
jgi:hypothetical protein